MGLLIALLLAAGAGVWLNKQWQASSPKRKPGTMLTEDEARDILGVSQDADAEAIRAAWKRLMAKLHPDQGGTDYLAARINAAKERLIGK